MGDLLLDEQWAVAELRIAALITRIQPNGHSEERRKAVIDYVQRLIQRCFDCQVFTFGSVPLKTYLPDGDIDLTVFSKYQNVRDSWANDVQAILQDEERRQDAEFCVKEVQCIRAEVKVVKCLVENIVVDISFNQLGGLCTLCFLEEVDRLIGHNHLFKRSIILVKAWCYYESRLLGAHHGLISTYALETLVLYIFHVFHTSLRGPLEVLFKFLDFFSNFNWNKYCLSLWGPILLSSLPDMSAEEPRVDGGKLLLSKEFLEACSDAYAVFPKGQDMLSRTFVSKHLNVVDPLRTNNNLGRSVSKANFFRIRSAFALGARKLAKIFESPKDLLMNLDNFFFNTWQRHHSGYRPDAPESIFPPPPASKVDGLVKNDFGSSENENIQEFQGSCSKYFPEEDSQQMLKEMPLQSSTNKLVELDVVGKEVSRSQVSSASVGDSDTPIYSAHSSPYREQADIVSEVLSKCKVKMDELKQEKVETEESIVKISGIQKSALPLRSRSIGKGLGMGKGLMGRSRSHIKRSTSDGGLEDLAETHLLNGSRMAGDARDLASIKHTYLDYTSKDTRRASRTMSNSTTDIASSSNGDEKGRFNDSNLLSQGKFIKKESSHIQIATGTLQDELQGRGLDCMANANWGDILQHSTWMNDNVTLAEPVLANASQSSIPEIESSSQTSMAVSIHPSIQHLHGQTPTLFSHPTETNAHIPGPLTSLVPASLAVPPPPIGLHLGTSNLSVTDSPISNGTVPHPGPYMLSQVPVPPPLPPFVGFPCMLDNVDNTQILLHNSGIENQLGSDLWWQTEQQELSQQLSANNKDVPTPTLPQASGNNQTWQAAGDVTKFEIDVPINDNVHSETLVKEPAIRGSKFSKDRRDSGPDKSMKGDTPESGTSGTPALSAAGEGAFGGHVQGTIDEVLPGTQSYVYLLPFLPGISPASANLLPSKNIPISTAGSDAQALPSYPLAAIQPLYWTTGAQTILPSPSYSPTQPLSVPVSVDSPSGFRPVDISSVSLSSSQQNRPPVDTKLPLGACNVYSTGLSFPSIALYNSFYTIHPGSENGLGMDLINEPIPRIMHENNANTTIDSGSSYLARTGLQMDCSVAERLKAVGVPVSSGSKLDSNHPSEDSEAGIDTIDDVLSSDFVSLLRNLEFGRWYQDPGMSGFMFPPQMPQSPIYLHGHHLWEGPGRPLHGAMNVPNGFFPSPLLGLSHMNGNCLNSFTGQSGFVHEDLPRSRTGTGTYLPSPRYSAYRDRQTATARNQQGKHHVQVSNSTGGYNSRQRTMAWGINSHDGRHQGHTSGERHIVEGRNRPENMRRKYFPGTGRLPLGNSTPTYTVPFSSLTGSNANVSEASYLKFSGSVRPTHSTVTPYPYVLPFMTEQVEFGSLGPVHLGEIKSGPGPHMMNHGRPQLSTASLITSTSNSGDTGLQQASASTGPNRANQRSYQLREEDFPPLSFHGQQGSNFVFANGSKNSNRGSH